MRSVKVGVVDSGINPNHRQIARVAGGIAIHGGNGDVSVDDAWSDELGHGTAVAATILAHAPDAELYSIRIFHRRLEAHPVALVRAIEWAHEQGLDLINLSLGCREPVPRVIDSPRIVAPADDGYPGSIPVRADRDLDVDELSYQKGVFVASAWAWPLPGLPKERNFHGTSLAVAHVSGFAALALASGVRPDELASVLRERCEKIES